MKIINVIKSVTVAATLAVSSLSFAADIDVNANANDLAIHGYDAVSYFTDSRAAKGSHKYTATYKSAINLAAKKTVNFFKKALKNLHHSSVAFVPWA